MAGYDLFWFVVLSIITRGGRFYIVAGLLNRFGGPIRTIMDRHAGFVVALLLAALIGGFLALRWLV
jgi:hypothetical protein